MIILTIVSIIWIAYELGREDGNWGWLITIGVIFLIGLIIASVK